MHKIIDIIYYVIWLIQRALEKKRNADTQERREQIEEDPSQAFQDKFKREDGAPVDYAEKDE